ncbi:divalent-cation tolerance protein CutA [Candidatus Nitrosocosmicus franklandus]|uniref:Divalent-cation tolerance protein CutA n=1 Tax=Candidatus Nitrosocosmicus franklandianus TaxID=1798806 RepID=A0A484I8U9_9ARCH|nr:divalent-cation tolerance protein CutA [Candidatus Nitrosocosmicus franklandus]VFJ14181.1 Divalent-cation tolerance protein CutA [Candidatus Nitrosocosmicus franklandus]
MKHSKIQSDGAILLSTFPDEKSLIRLCKVLVADKRLCACVNYTKINSLYTWENELKQEEEFLAIFKTTSKLIDALKTEITVNHPYQIPEIIVLSMKDVSSDYMLWLVNNTRTT